LPADVRRVWDQLADAAMEVTDRFDPASVDDLPEPAGRWLRHAIAPQTPLRYCVELDQHGTINLGGWRPFRAEQVLTPSAGYLWAETTRLFGLPIRGYDLLCDDRAEVRHRALNAITVARAHGPDLARSAGGRLAAEIVWVPAVALTSAVHWTPGDDSHVTALISYEQWTHEVTLTVAPSGAVQRVSVPRWARVGKQPWRTHLFEALLHEQATFDGYTVPLRTTAGYDLNPARPADSSFITQVIDSASYR
jgi:hypothetical protein